MRRASSRKDGSPAESARRSSHSSRSGAVSASRSIAAVRSAAVGAVPEKPKAAAAAASRASVAGARVNSDGVSGRVFGCRMACVRPGAGMRTSTTCSARREASGAPDRPRWRVKRLASNVPVARAGGMRGSSVAGTAPKRSVPSASSGAGRSSPPAVPPSWLTR